jgi:hypothetical protein
MKQTLTILVLAFAVAAGVYLSYRPEIAPPPTVSSAPLADDTVVIYEPLPESVISSPLKIRGKARGFWFFEASFPVTLTNWDGLIIAQTPAQALGDWMTEDWVEFEAILEFTPDVNVSSRAFLILQKDNPSDLPENDDSREMTLFFAE